MSAKKTITEEWSVPGSFADALAAVAARTNELGTAAVDAVSLAYYGWNGLSGQVKTTWTITLKYTQPPTPA